MRIKELIRTVLLSISTNKFRVFLTSLGIIIGTFTIIIVVGIGKASEIAVASQYKRLSVESITISRPKSAANSGAKSLLKDDALAMSEQLENVKSVGISASITSAVSYGATSLSIPILGTNEEYANITNLETTEGYFYTDEDGKMRNRVIVLGYNVANELFGDAAMAIGNKVTIKSTNFEVIGVLNRIGGSGGVSTQGSGGASSADDMVFVPYDVSIKYLTGTTGTKTGSSSSANITFIALANDINSVKPAIEEIYQYIYQKVGDAGYTVTDAGSTLTSALETTKTMSLLLISVAVIVLVVSGIGIMNVLMVSVKERTREIGILKSIGAARKVILLQFLLEATFISLLGGILGVILSLGAPYVLSFTSLSYLPSIEGILLGLGFSVSTGIFFGYYPAAKASKLKPIDALNYE